MWYLVCWGQCEGTTSSPNVTQEEFLVPSLLSFCVFTEVLASSCCSFSSAGRQVRGSDIMKQNRDSTTESQAPWVLDSVLLSLVMWSWAHCLTLLKPKNKVLLYTSRVQAGDSRPLQSHSFKNRVPRKAIGLGDCCPPQAWLSVILWEESFSPDLSVLDPELGGNPGLAAPRQMECGSFHPSPP